MLGRGHEYLRQTTGVPTTYHRIQHGDSLRIGARAFQVITGGGHALEQAMLYRPEEQLFFAADQVIARISPNVSVHAMEPDLDALGIYLRSLSGLRDTVAPDVLVLPGHGLPFYGLHERIAELIEHHAQRCAAIADACRQQPLSVADIVPHVFHRELDEHQTGFAFGEVLAHVNHMLGLGQLVLETGEPQPERAAASSTTLRIRPISIGCPRPAMRRSCCSQPRAAARSSLREFAQHREQELQWILVGGGRHLIHERANRECVRDIIDGPVPTDPYMRLSRAVLATNVRDIERHIHHALTQLAGRPVGCVSLERRADRGKHGAMQPRDRLAVRVQTAFQMLCRDRVIVAVGEIVLAAPRHLHRCADRACQKRRLRHIVRFGLSPKPATEQGHVHRHVRLIDPQHLGDRRAGLLRVLRGRPYRATARSRHCGTGLRFHHRVREVRHEVIGAYLAWPLSARPG